MKYFVGFLIKILFFLLVSLWALDTLYTKVYENSNYRNKIQYAINTPPKHYHLLFLGSSRANNHFVPSEFKKNKEHVFNFGMSGSSLQENLLLLQLLIAHKNTINNVVLEADLNLSNVGFSEGTQALFMPYIKNDASIATFYSKELNQFSTLSNFPFYRYIKFETKIGCREFLFTLFKKKSNFLEQNGYSPLMGSSATMEYNLLHSKPIKNKYYEAIKKLCLKNKIKLTVVMTPMCENTKGLDYFTKVQKMYPEIHNFENAITEDKYFSSCGHLNDEGAKKFTNFLIEKLSL